MYVGTYLFEQYLKMTIFLEFIVCLRGGTNSSMFANCLVLRDVREVQNLVLRKKWCLEVFKFDFEDFVTVWTFSLFVMFGKLFGFL